MTHKQLLSTIHSALSHETLQDTVQSGLSTTTSSSSLRGVVAASCIELDEVAMRTVDPLLRVMLRAQTGAANNTQPS